MKVQVRLVLLLAAVLALSSPGYLEAQQVAGGTRQLNAQAGGGANSWEDAYNKNVPELTEVATKEFVDPLAKEFVKSCNDNAAALETTAKKVATKVSSPRSSGMSKTMRDRGRALIKESEKSSGWYRRLGKWAEKGAKFLKMVDFVSTTAQAAGYLAEGDKTGAVNVVVNDVSKKTCAAGGSFVLSWIPVVGPAGGAAAGEELHNAYIKPALDKRADELREKEAKEKGLGKPWMPPNLVIDRQGQVRELPDDMYVDANTGNVVRRTAQEQKNYEHFKRVEWLDGKKLQQVQTDALDGKIPPDQYGKLIRDFKHRDRSKPWDPPELQRKEAEDQSVTDGEDQEEETAEDIEDEDEEEKEEDVEDEAEPEEPPEEGDDEIFKYVSPQTVTAVGKTEQDLSAGEFTNIATTTYTLKFWNVGGKAQGYGAASLAVVTTFTMHPAVEKASCGGHFSGGPNGSFTLACEDSSVNFSLSNGQVVRGGGVTLTVQNPGAFNNWPKEFR